jgi:hypothetical protein
MLFPSEMPIHQLVVSYYSAGGPHESGREGKACFITAEVLASKSDYIKPLKSGDYVAGAFKDIRIYSEVFKSILLKNVVCKQIFADIVLLLFM